MSKCNICQKEIGNEWISVPSVGGICYTCYGGRKHEKLENSFFLKGRAIGLSDIKTDCVVFHYRKDIYNLPTSRMRGLVKYNKRWGFYTAPISKLKYAAEKVFQ